MSIRSDTLETKLSALLKRLSPPRLMTVEVQADEMDALARAIDRAAPRDGYDAWWPQFEDSLLSSMTTRAWPTVGEIARAAKSIHAPRSATEAETESHEVYGWILEWWHKHRDCPRHLAKSHHACRMIAEGIATPGQLRRGGFPLTDRDMAAAEAEPDPQHPSILADIHAIGDRIRDNKAASAAAGAGGTWKHPFAGAAE